MNLYEALLIFKPILDMEYADTALRNFENTIKQLGGQVVKVEKMGRKRLAYDITKFKDGLLSVIYFEMLPEKVTELRRIQGLNEDLLRMTLLRMEPELKEEVIAGTHRSSRFLARDQREGGPGAPGQDFGRGGPPRRGPRRDGPPPMMRPQQHD